MWTGFADSRCELLSVFSSLDVSSGFSIAEAILDCVVSCRTSALSSHSDGGSWNSETWECFTTRLEMCLSLPLDQRSASFLNVIHQRFNGWDIIVPRLSSPPITPHILPISDACLPCLQFLQPNPASHPTIYMLAYADPLLDSSTPEYLQLGRS